MIRVRDLDKYYESDYGRSYVLRQIDLDVEPGEFITIMGPSGAGKTTLLNVLGMLDDDWSGEYWFLDQPVHEMKPKHRNEVGKQHIGFVPQRFHFQENLTVYENLEISLSHRSSKQRERQAMVADILDRFQIVGKKDLHPGQLSGGQQQLVAVARAVIGDPQLILADEPTGNLHPSQGVELMDLLRHLNEHGTTIIQVTHSETYAAYGERIVNLFDGWVVDPDEIPGPGELAGAEA